MFRLARELGMTVAELLSKLDSREISEWHAYFLNEHEDALIAESKAKAEAEAKRLKNRR